MSEKLHKVLAAIGVGSRRSMEEYISAGRVSVDGKIAKLGDRVEGTEVIRVDGQIIHTSNSPKSVCRVLMYNKPEGQMCTRSDPEGRPTVFDRLPVVSNGRWLYIGRLDINTSGLLLFTTDGELANRLMHPSHAIERVYAVRVFGGVTADQIRQLQTGVELEDGPAHFDSVEYVGGEGINQWYNVVLKEGRKREVRRLWEALGFKVSRLKRIRYANVELDRLPVGGWRELNLAEVNALREVAGMKPETETFVDDKELTVRQAYVKNRQVRRAVQNFNSQNKNQSRHGGFDRSAATGRNRDAQGKSSVSRDFRKDFKKNSSAGNDAFESRLYRVAAENGGDRKSAGKRHCSPENKFAPYNGERKKTGERSGRFGRDHEGFRSNDGRHGGREYFGRDGKGFEGRHEHAGRRRESRKGDR